MEVRVKLHVNKSSNDDVQNVWMSLNYERTPTINHIIGYLKKNFQIEKECVGLYLDDYWLPPWENSRLLRENDCIKVLIEPEKGHGEETDKNSKQFVNNSKFQQQNVDQTLLNNTEIQPAQQSLSNQQKKSNLFINDRSYEKIVEKTIKNDFKKPSPSPSPPTQLPIAKTAKKFSIANYVHLLGSDQNELNEEKKNTKSKNECSTDDIERIAQNINSTAKSKWKNSTKPLNTTTKPQHIIFHSDSSESSSSSDSSSDSSSSDSSDAENENEQKPIQKNQNFKTQIQPVDIVESKNSKSQSQKAKQYQNQTKNATQTVSYNRSFIIENNQSLNEFKNTFNETKYKSPKIDEDRKLDTIKDSNIEVNETENFEMNEAEPVDYEKYELVVGVPNVNDKIAFQVLEISENFTPELSAYKTGTVTDYDMKTGEITLKLDFVYNEILQKPNKFTVIDDDENENINEKTTDCNETNEDDNLLKIDWNNLMNLRKIPNIESK